MGRQIKSRYGLTMSDKYDYTGGVIDASWQTAPWNRDGETIEKATENEEGKITMTELPEEVDVEELSENQEEIIRTAVRNVGLSCAQVEDIVGFSRSYVARVLRNEAPEWYENTFKENGKSTKKARDDYKTSAEVLAEETGRDKEEFELDDDTEVPNYPHPSELESVPNAERSHARDYRDNTTDAPDWKSYAVVALLSFVVGLLWGGRNE